MTQILKSSFLVVATLALLTGVGCSSSSDKNGDGSGGSGSGGGGINTEFSAVITTDPDVNFTFNDVVFDENTESPFFPLIIRSSGQGTLIISEILIEDLDGGDEFALLYEVPKYKRGDATGQPRADVHESELCPNTNNFPLEEGLACVVFVVYEPKDQRADQGRIKILSNDNVDSEKVISIETITSGPKLAVIPPGEVVFEDVLQGEKKTKTIILRNVGTADLDVSQIDLINNANGDFKVEFSANSVFSSLPAKLAPQDESSFIELNVTYEPEHAGQDNGEISIRSNDVQTPEVIVSLVAKSIFPCVQVNPLDIDFRQVLIGTAEELTIDITNCGNADLEITRLEMVEGSSTDFNVISGLDGLTDTCLEGGAEACTGSAIIAGNDTRTVLVRYAPADEGADGGRVAVHTMVSGQETVEVNLFGRGTDNQPPSCLAEARISGAPEWGIFPDEDELLETIPLKTIELRADNSRDPDGVVAAYKWSVLERPDDSTARILPHEGAPQATFFLDLAGLYVFELEVTDNYGHSSNPNCQVVVEAIPDEDIHIQLVWDTPADPDQTDKGFGAGSDIDLHLLHPLGDWFCAPRDVYYANPNPDWGVPFDQSDDPSLDIDDTDGAGPENINLNHPENNRVYRVGGHYFNDHGYGPSFVTVRIFIQGTLRFELANKRMAGTDQFWDVATIAWPSGSITPIDQLYDAPPNEDCQR